jgi:macrocin-O-methyltransferase TylF-like protien
VRFVHAHRRVNYPVRAVRFWQQVPLRDLRNLRRTVSILRVRTYTMMTYQPLVSLWKLAKSLGVPGALVECGSCKGGSGAIIGAAAPTRTLWLFDSWQGLPEPGQVDIDAYGLQRPEGWNFGTQEETRRALRRLRVNGARVRMVRGWFEETISEKKAEIGPIALLHIDADYYESVKLVLTELYPQVTSGGVVAIDDYGHWKGCRTAVDEYFDDVRTMPGFEVVGQTIRFFKP